MLSLCMITTTLVGVVVLVVVVVIVVIVSLARTAEQGVDSQEPLDYLNRPHSLSRIDSQIDDGK